MSRVKVTKFEDLPDERKENLGLANLDPKKARLKRALRGATKEAASRGRVTTKGAELGAAFDRLPKRAHDEFYIVLDALYYDFKGIAAKRGLLVGGAFNGQSNDELPIQVPWAEAAAAAFVDFMRDKTSLESAVEDWKPQSWGPRGQKQRGVRLVPVINKRLQAMMLDYWGRRAVSVFRSQQRARVSTWRPGMEVPVYDSELVPDSAPVAALRRLGASPDDVGEYADLVAMLRDIFEGSDLDFEVLRGAIKRLPDPDDQMLMFFAHCAFSARAQSELLKNSATERARGELRDVLRAMLRSTEEEAWTLPHAVHVMSFLVLGDAIPFEEVHPRLLRSARWVQQWVKHDGDLLKIRWSRRDQIGPPRKVWEPPVPTGPKPARGGWQPMSKPSKRANPRAQAQLSTKG